MHGGRRAHVRRISARAVWLEAPATAEREAGCAGGQRAARRRRHALRRAWAAYCDRCDHAGFGATAFKERGAVCAGSNISRRGHAGVRPNPLARAALAGARALARAQMLARAAGLTRERVIVVAIARVGRAVVHAGIARAGDRHDARRVGAVQEAGLCGHEAADEHEDGGDDRLNEGRCRSDARTRVPGSVRRECTRSL